MVVRRSNEFLLLYVIRKEADGFVKSALDSRLLGLSSAIAEVVCHLLLPCMDNEGGASAWCREKVLEEICWRDVIKALEELRVSGMEMIELDCIEN